MENYSPTENTTAQWFEAHAAEAEIIDVPAIQAGRVQSLQEFEEKLKEYSSDNYKGIEPFIQLLRYSQYAVGQYDQFAHALRRHAVEQGAEPDMIDESIRSFRQFCFDQSDNLETICQTIRTAAADPEHAQHVSVLCLPCGAGKSTALTKLMYDVIRQDHSEGLIVVTDSVERMKAYWKKDSSNPSFDTVMRRFIRDHTGDVVVLTSENLRSAMGQQYHAPVVVISTQRYFAWSKEEIQRLLRWEKGIRPLIIFDEMPYLSQVHDVTPETLDRISTRLRMGIEVTNEENRVEKRRMTAYWEQIRKKILARLESMEDAAIPMGFFAAESDETWEEFVAYVKAHESKLNTQNESVSAMVEDVQALLTEWGVYAHRSSEQAGAYENKFAVYRDFRELVTDLDAKVIVLDGTADISPLYHEDYVHILPNREFIRSLSYLTIKLCDVDTSEKALREGRGQVQKTIYRYLKEAVGHDPNLVVFTRKSAEESFHRLGIDAAHTGHFNNIKGLNSYNQSTNIAQVGLNRLPPVNYFVMDLAHDAEAREALVSVQTMQGLDDATQQVRKDMGYNIETMTRSVLADIEQNLFRSAIRNVDNVQPVTYYLFFAHERYEELITAIKARYGRLGAKVETVGGEVVQAYANADIIPTRIQRTSLWLQEWDGKPMRRRDLLKELAMNRNAFDVMLRHRDAGELKRQYKQYAQSAKEAGYPAGWIKK